MLKQGRWVFVLLGVDATLGDKCIIWEYLHSFRMVKWERRVSQRLNILICVWCKSRELRNRVSPRFPSITPVMESFFSDHLQAKISYWTESHLESCQTSIMELFYENSQRVSPKFHCVTPVMESFFFALLQAIIRYWTELHLESCQTYIMEFICENSQRPKGLKYFLKKYSMKSVFKYCFYIF